MRKYKLTQIAAPVPDGVRASTKLYTIYLGPGSRHNFKSYRAARNFAAQYSRDINRVLHVYNMLLADLYATHRRAWHYYFDISKAKNFLDIEGFIQTCINDAERNLHRAIHNTRGIHIAGHIWNLVCQICENLQQGFTRLAAFLFARRLYTESEQCKIYCSQAENEKTRMCGLYGLSAD